MKIFLDTANIDEIREAASWGVLRGVTTNPSLIAKEGKDFHQVIMEIAAIVDGPISAEVNSTTAEAMIEEGRPYADWGDNVVVKIPMGKEGLKAVHGLSKEGIKCNVTLIFSANQALMAAAAGAAYVSPFIGRLDDISSPGMDIIHDITQIFEIYDIKTELIAASIRHPLHVIEAARAGAHIATIPFKVLNQMIEHPLTDAGMAKFLADWEASRAKAC